MEYSSKVDIVLAAIRSDIEKGVYIPGEKITISRVAKKLQCSETPVREALRRLESERVVKIVPNVGAIVESFGREYLEQLVSVKTVLEEYALSLCIERITASDIKKLRALNVDMEKEYNRGNLKKCSDLNHRFHMHLYRISGNEVLSSYIHEMWLRWPIGKYAEFVSKERYEESFRQHNELLEAIECKDSVMAQEILKAHKTGSLNNFESNYKFFI